MILQCLQSTSGCRIPPPNDEPNNDTVEMEATVMNQPSVRNLCETLMTLWSFMYIPITFCIHNRKHTYMLSVRVVFNFMQNKSSPAVGNGDEAAPEHNIQNPPTLIVEMIQVITKPWPSFTIS